MKIFIKGQEIALKNDISTVYKYKGSVANEASLPTENNAVGDVYNCEDTGNNFAWEGTKWDKLAGTVDLSNYYTKAQADARTEAIIADTIDINNYYTKEQADASTEAIVEERITELGTNDLLHYKGHVDTVDELPSLGQPTGVVTTQTVTIKSSLNDEVIPLDTTMGGLVSVLPYYLCANNYDSVSGDYRIFLETEYPEVIHAVVSYIQGGTGNTGSLYRGYLGYYIEHNPEKPVYLTATGNHNYFPRRVYTNESGSWAQISAGPASISRQIVNANSDYIIMPYGYSNVGGGNFGGSITYGSALYINSNLPYLKLRYINLGINGNVLCDSVKLNKENYYYNDGMKFLEADVNGQMHFVKNVTSTVLNDTYTVGDSYDIYRRNELPAWERWSQGVSKDYVDSIVGGVNTELETIINGEE